MEKNPHLYLSEVVFSSADKAESKAISRMLKDGVIRKIAPRVYTSNLEDSPENITKRNLFIILGHLFPKAVISHRSAFEFQPTSGGHIFLTYSYNRNVSLPGVMVHLMEGQGGMKDDIPFIEGLYVSRQERAFLENMQVSKKKGDESKTLPQQIIEEKLEAIIRTNGEDALNTLRDNAREIAENLHMKEEFEKLNKIISALLSTRSSNMLKSPLAMARAFGQPYDPARLELFHLLFSEL